MNFVPCLQIIINVIMLPRKQPVFFPFTLDKLHRMNPHPQNDLLNHRAFLARIVSSPIVVVTIVAPFPEKIPVAPFTPIIPGMIWMDPSIVIGKILYIDIKCPPISPGEIVMVRTPHHQLLHPLITPIVEDLYHEKLKKEKPTFDKMVVMWLLTLIESKECRIGSDIKGCF